MNEIISKFAKFITPKDNTYPKWFSNIVIQLRTEKELYRDLLHKTGLNHFNALYKSNRKLFKREKEKCEKNFILNTKMNINVNPKAFFAYTKALSKPHKPPNTLSYKGKTSDKPTEIAEFFADNFKSVYNTTDSNYSNTKLSCNCTDHVSISHEDILNTIKNFDMNKISSPDGIPIIFYSDLTELLFADDLKILAKIDTILISIEKWCHDNKLSLNANKCKILSISRKPIENILSFIYKIGNTALLRTESIRDLGVIYDSKFSLQPHNRHITKRAYRMIGFIIRSLFRFNVTFEAFWSMHLQYGTPITPFTQTKSRKFNENSQEYLHTNSIFPGVHTTHDWNA